MTRENPVGTRGVAFVEFSATQPEALVPIFEKMGLELTGKMVSRRTRWYQAGGVNFLLSGTGPTFAQDFCGRHGPSACAMGFLVEDAGHALQEALKRGAVAYDGTRGETTLNAPAIWGIGGSLIYFVEEHAQSDWRSVFQRVSRTGPPAHGEAIAYDAIDHITHNVVQGGLETWRSFYSKIFGFRPVFELEVEGQASGFRTYALRSPCDKICIPINEPTDLKSQIQEFVDIYKGEGIQHIALSCENIYDAVGKLQTRDFSFQSIPDTYYSMIEDRLPGHGEDVDLLKACRILIDGNVTTESGEEADILLQIFSTNIIGPIFFEFIQRKGNDGFGEGNAIALFESIEREQIERGYITVEG